MLSLSKTPAAGFEPARPEGQSLSLQDSRRPE